MNGSVVKKKISFSIPWYVPNTIERVMNYGNVSFQILSPVRSRAGDPLWGNFADEKTVTRTPHILLSCWSVLYGLDKSGSGITVFHLNLVQFSSPHEIIKHNQTLCMFDEWNPKWMCLLTHCSLIADTTFDHMLVDFALHTNKRLTHSAADDRSTAALRRTQRGIGWRSLAQHRQGRGWREIWDGKRAWESM